MRRTTAIEAALPGEIWTFHIFSKLGVADLLRVAQVCRLWRRCSESLTIWRPIADSLDVFADAEIAEIAQIAEHSHRRLDPEREKGKQGATEQLPSFPSSSSSSSSSSSASVSLKSNNRPQQTQQQRGQPASLQHSGRSGAERTFLRSIRYERAEPTAMNASTQAMLRRQQRQRLRHSHSSGKKPMQANDGEGLEDEEEDEDDDDDDDEDEEEEKDDADPDVRNDSMEDDDDDEIDLEDSLQRYDFTAGPRDNPPSFDVVDVNGSPGLSSSFDSQPSREANTPFARRFKRAVLEGLRRPRLCRWSSMQRVRAGFGSQSSGSQSESSSSSSSSSSPFSRMDIGIHVAEPEKPIFVYIGGVGLSGYYSINYPTGDVMQLLELLTAGKACPFATWDSRWAYTQGYEAHTWHRVPPQGPVRVWMPSSALKSFSLTSSSTPSSSSPSSSSSSASSSVAHGKSANHDGVSANLASIDGKPMKRQRSDNSLAIDSNSSSNHDADGNIVTGKKIGNQRKRNRHRGKNFSNDNNNNNNNINNDNDNQQQQQQHHQQQANLMQGQQQSNTNDALPVAAEDGSQTPEASKTTRDPDFDQVIVEVHFRLGRFDKMHEKFTRKAAERPSCFIASLPCRCCPLMSFARQVEFLREYMGRECQHLWPLVFRSRRERRLWRPSDEDDFNFFGLFHDESRSELFGRFPVPLMVTLALEECSHPNQPAATVAEREQFWRQLDSLGRYSRDVLHAARYCVGDLANVAVFQLHLVAAVDRMRTLLQRLALQGNSSAFCSPDPFSSPSARKTSLQQSSSSFSSSSSSSSSSTSAEAAAAGSSHSSLAFASEKELPPLLQLDSNVNGAGLDNANDTSSVAAAQRKKDDFNNEKDVRNQPVQQTSGHDAAGKSKERDDESSMDVAQAHEAYQDAERRNDEVIAHLYANPLFKQVSEILFTATHHAMRYEAMMQA